MNDLQRAAHGPLWKTPRVVSKARRLQDARDRRTAEDRNKQEVRRRDKRCRFPLCGCLAMKWAPLASPEVSHNVHKGIGGDPSGQRSLANRMVLMCHHRHQDGYISRHKGTLRAAYLTDKRAAGPIAWQIRAVELRAICRAAGVPMPHTRREWVTVARERAINDFEQLAPWQEDVLKLLADSMQTDRPW